MTIAIIGNSYFGKKLQKQLVDFDTKNSYIFFDTNVNFFDKIKYVLYMPFIDIVYSIGADLNGGGALKLALKQNKKIFQHFIGSDVLSAKKDTQNKHTNQKLIQKSNFLCEVEWIQKELKDIDIKADITSIMIVDKFLKPKSFQKFSVLTYIAKDKEEFYGIKDLIKLANDFLDVEFKIAGISEYKNLPKNIKPLGWVDMTKELQNSTVFIRNTYHDGLSFSVVEALSLGRVVFYNYDFTCVKYFKNYDELKEKFSKILKDFKDGKLTVEEKSIDFVKDNFSKQRVLNNLIKRLTK